MEDVREEELKRRFADATVVTTKRKKRDHYDWTYFAEKQGYPDERTMLADLYNNKAMSIRDIAFQFGLSASTIRFRMKRHGITTRSPGGANNIGTAKRFEHFLNLLNKPLKQAIEEYGSVNQMAIALNIPVAMIVEKINEQEAGADENV